MSAYVSGPVALLKLPHQEITVFPFALQKTNFEDQIIVSNLTSGVYKFQLTVTDNSGQSDSTKVTVLVLTPEQSEREYGEVIFFLELHKI